MHRFTIILILALSGCSWNWKFWDSKPSFESQSLRVHELRRALICGTPTEDSVIRLFDSAAALRAWDGSERLHLETLELPAERAFVLIEQGLRRTGGYSIELRPKASLSESGTLTIQADWLEPQPDRMLTQILTSLCVLSAVPARPYLRVEVGDQAGQIRAFQVVER